MYTTTVDRELTYKPKDQHLDLSGSETYLIRRASLRNAIRHLQVVRSSRGDPIQAKIT